jgi:hypothetical protein
MKTEYGKQITTAFRAVYQLFEEISRLLQDCDGTVGHGKTSLFGNVVTRALSRSIDNPGAWFASNLYRYYEAGEAFPGIVEGLNIYLWDEPALYEEPLLIAGQIKYHLGEGESVKDVCNEWDVWKAYFKWCDNRRVDDVISFRRSSDEEGRTEWFKLCAIPLYSIKSIEQVGQLMERVRASPI